MERGDTSTKALARWADWVLKKKGLSLKDIAELGDGNKLARLVEGASGKTVPLSDRHGAGAKGVQNILVLYNILAFLSSEGMQIPQSCSPQALAAGDHDQTAGLLKRLAWQYLIMSSTEPQPQARRAVDGGLIAWAMKALQSSNIVVGHSTLYNGEVIIALIDLMLGSSPDAEDFASLDLKAKQQLLGSRLAAAEEKLGIPQVVEPSDFLERKIDLTSLLVCLALLRRRLETGSVEVAAQRQPSSKSAPSYQHVKQNNLSTNAETIAAVASSADPKEIEEMKRRMEEKDRELEAMKAKVEQTKREAEEEMKRLMEEIKAMKEKEKLSSANSAVQPSPEVTDISQQEEDTSPEPQRPARPDRKTGSRRKPSPLATSSSATTPSPSSPASLASRPSLPQSSSRSNSVLSQSSPVSSPSASPASSPYSSSSSLSLRTSAPLITSGTKDLPLPPLELHITQIAQSEAESPLETVQSASPLPARKLNRSATSPLTSPPTKGAYARKKSMHASPSSKRNVMDNFVDHFEREIALYEQVEQKEVPVELQTSLPQNQEQPPDLDIAAARAQAEQETERLKREVQSQLAELEKEASILENSPSQLRSSDPVHNHKVPTVASASTSSTSDEQRRNSTDAPRQTIRDLIPKLRSEQSASKPVPTLSKLPPMDFLSPRSAEEVYTKIPSWYPLDEEGDSDAILDTILMQIDLNRKQQQMTPRDKEEYEDYMREKREVDKQKQHLLDSGLSAAFPDEHTSDSGPMPLVSPTTSSEDLQSITRSRSQTSPLSSTELPIGGRARAGTYHISELVDDADSSSGLATPRLYASPQATSSLKEPTSSPRGELEKSKKDAKKDKKEKKKEKKDKKEKEKLQKDSHETQERADEQIERRKKRNSLTNAFGSLKIKSPTKEKRTSMLRTTSFSSRFLPRSRDTEDKSEKKEKSPSPSSSPKLNSDKKERSWRDLRSSFSFSRKNRSASVKKRPQHDSTEGVKGLMIALYDFQARKEDEICFNRGDLIYLMSDLDETGWALGKIKQRRRRMYESEGDEDTDRIGLFPVEFVRMASEGEAERQEDPMDEDMLPPLPSEGSFGSSSSLSSNDTSSRSLSSLVSSSSDIIPVGEEGVHTTPNGAQGWLYLKHSSKKWKPHHFVLEDDSLIYYKNQKRNGKKPLGKIPIGQSWLEVSRALDEKQKKANCILIATQSGKSYYLHTTNRNELEAWLEVFRTAPIAGLRKI